MNIQGYIIDYWISRMSDENPLLIIYDPQGMYKSLLAEAVERGIKVVDTTLQPLSVREEACEYWMKHLTVEPEARMIIYRACAMPVNRRQKIADPYMGMRQGGVVFPDGPNDDYVFICKRFLPDKAAEIAKLEAQGNLSFENINALQDGAAYPELENLTHKKSPAEITVEFLSMKTVSRLGWKQEWSSFVEVYYPGLDSAGSTLKAIQDKLWNYLLFSEFVLDLPLELPASLKSVPVAPDELRPVVYELCKTIRNRNDLREEYVRQALKIARELDLERLFSKANNLGDIVTFAFENSVEFDRYLAYLKKDEPVRASLLLDKNLKDIWYQADKQVAAFWDLAQCAELLFRCAGKGDIHADTLNALIGWYVANGYEADLAFRKYHTKLTALDFDMPQICDLTSRFNEVYRNFTESVQAKYQQLVQQEGWNHLAIDYNLGAFGRYLSADLKQGKRVVFIMADAFRYEMGMNFAEDLSGYEIECKPSAAYLPPVTRFGMAALLPQAEERLHLEVVGDELQPLMDDVTVKNPADRITYIRETTDAETADFTIHAFSPSAVPETARLLVLRSTHIDNSGENNNIQAFQTMDTEMKSFARIVSQVWQLGFDTLYIMADHGYMFQPDFTPGDKIPAPTGKAVLQERRCMGGDLNESAGTCCFVPEQLGIRSSLSCLSFARQYGVFKSGCLYFHEGLSLQENIVPIVKVCLKREEQPEGFTISLTYKGGKVNIYRPKIELSVQTSGLFSPAISVRLEIKNSAGDPAGHVVASGFYNETTETVIIPEDVKTIKQAIEIDENADGEIKVTALHPETNATLATLVLQTDFMF